MSFIDFFYMITGQRRVTSIVGQFNRTINRLEAVADREAKRLAALSDLRARSWDASHKANVEMNHAVRVAGRLRQIVEE